MVNLQPSASIARTVSLIVACALAACTQTGSGTPTSSAAGGPGSKSTASPSQAEVPVGWERHAVDDAGFAISLPREWAAIDLTEGELEELLDEMYVQFPEMAEQRELFDQAMASGFAFLAMDFSSETIGSEFVTNVNVIEDEGEAPLSIIAAGNAQTIENTFGVAPDQERSTLPAGEAVIMRWELPDSHAVVQYYIVGGGSSFVVTFSRQLGDEYVTVEPLFASIMETFEILP